MSLNLSYLKSGDELTAEYQSYEVAYALTHQKLNKKAPIGVPQTDWNTLWAHLDRIQTIQAKFTTPSPKEKLLKVITKRDFRYYQYGYPPANKTYTEIYHQNSSTIFQIYYMP